ncbi:hypothetical protein RvY_15935 [Ramazzottius varieornatus]|uniref:DNA2/NAM7 helicase-like C-terminal domain-containing protein n=1 Tax=Ramazzottius varieornatus TaxID=947166 RepID=A0A1D1VXR0_RAMVA|nr:hypothetical protein RvY_15935 [Ramazzottius varieornatus]
MLGTVDEYQGKEKPVIIISTVREFSPHARDLRSLLGFVASPKLINVALTKARETLMIVGDPYALIKDPNWKAVVRFCYGRMRYAVREIGDNVPCPKAVRWRKQDRLLDPPVPGSKLPPVVSSRSLPLRVRHCLESFSRNPFVRLMLKIGVLAALAFFLFGLLVSKI